MMPTSDKQGSVGEPLTERQIILARLVEEILSWSDSPPPETPPQEKEEKPSLKKRGRKHLQKQDKD